MAINDDHLFTSIWNDVKTVLLAGNIIASSGSTTSSVSILGEYNDSHTNHPQVIIYPVVLSEDSFTFQGQYGKRTINVIIECVHTNSRAVDYMAETVHAIMTSTVFDTMALVAVHDDPDIGFPGDRKVLSRIQTFVFERE